MSISIGEAAILAIAVLLAVLAVYVLTSTVWASARGGPWIPTPKRTVRRMLELAAVQPGEVVYDLGSGDGRVIIMAAREFGARAVGIEIDPMRCLWTKLVVASLGLREQVQVVWGDVQRQDLSRADVVTAYLLQKTNNRLMAKLVRELRPGTRVVSRVFVFPGWPVVGQDGEAELYLYRVGETR